MILKRKNLYFFLLFLALLFLVPGLAQGKEEFTVALTGKYPPFSFYSEEGKLTGFDVDVSKAIAKKIDKKLDIVATEWDGILAGLLTGKYDAIIGSMAVTPERKGAVNFSRPYYVSGAQLFVKKSSKDKIKSIKDLRGKRVGVGIGETYEHYLRKEYPSIDTLAYKGTVDIFQDMINGRIQGFVTDRLVGLYQIRQGGMSFVPAGDLLYKEKMAIPVVKEKPDLLRKINHALGELEKEGGLTRLKERWFGQEIKETSSSSSGMTTDVIVKKLLRGFGVTLLVAFASLVLGFLISIPSGIVLNNKLRFLYFPLRSFNDFVRGTPLLIQLFFVYYGAPSLGIVFSPIQAAIVALTINCSAYMAEVIRSGLMSVSFGQKLAAKALGLTKVQSFRYIIWPQAFRIALPPLMNSVVALMKDTALIAVISVGEVIREAQSIISVTYNPIKYYLIVAVMFFVFTFPLMKFSGIIEKRIKEKGFTNA